MVKDKLQLIKEHISRNKAAYISGGICLTAGVIGGVLFARQVSVSQKAQNIALLNWKPLNFLNQTVIVELPARGNRGNVIYCNELKKFFASQNEAVKELGLDQGNLSRHLNGDLPHVGKLTFKRLGENLTEQVNTSI